MRALSFQAVVLMIWCAVTIVNGLDGEDGIHLILAGAILTTIGHIVSSDEK